MYTYSCTCIMYLLCMNAWRKLDGKVNTDICFLSLGTAMLVRQFLTTTRTNFNFVVVGTEPTEELLQLVYAGW